MQAYRVHSSKEEAHTDGVWSVAWSKDKLITGSVDSSVKIWKGDTLENTNTLSGHRLGVISVVTEKSGTYACTSSMDSMIKVWDVIRGTEVATIEAAPVEAWTLSFSPDSRFVATGTQTGNVNVYSIEKAQLEQSLDMQKKTFIMTVAYSPNGRYIAAGGQDGTVAIFDVATSKLKHTLEGHSMTIRSVAFTNDSERLLTASDDKHINVYDVKQGTLITTLSGHSSYVLSLAVSPTGFVFASSSDRQVKIWELSTLECIHTFEDHKDQIWSVAFDETGARLASVSDDHSIRIYACPLDNSK